MKTIYVVAWEAEGYGGLDWWPTREGAEASYESELPEVQKDCIGIYLFEYQTDLTDKDAITEEVDRRTWEEDLGPKLAYRKWQNEELVQKRAAEATV